MTAVAPLFGGAPPEQDWFQLGAAFSPGVCTIHGDGLIRTWDKQKGWGSSGATLRYTGDDLPEFEIDIYLWEPEHFIAWELFSKLALERPPAGALAFAQAIKHPILNGSPNNIDAVIVKGVSLPEQDETGGWTYSIKFSQFRAPVPALGTPKQVIPPAGGNPPSAKDAQDAQILTLTAQAEELGNQAAKKP